jgi:hypothetical protein
MEKPHNPVLQPCEEAEEALPTANIKGPTERSLLIFLQKYCTHLFRSGPYSTNAKAAEG